MNFGGTQFNPLPLPLKGLSCLRVCVTLLWGLPGIETSGKSLLVPGLD